MAGKFITFEGGEGAGKSTQIRRLAARLEAGRIAGRHHARARRHAGGRGDPPSSSSPGAPKRWGAEGEALLFAAARADHVDAHHPPGAGRSATGCSRDRFTDSTRVYQGAEGGVDAGDPRRAGARRRRAETGRDLTVILDIPAEIGLRRVRARQADAGGGPDRFESEELGLHERRRQAYLDIAAREPEPLRRHRRKPRRGRSRRRASGAPSRRGSCREAA